MSGRQTMYLYLIQQSQQQTSTCSRTFDLGQHTLEVLENQAFLLVENEQGKETVQLDREEGYRLLITLQELFREEQIPQTARGNQEAPCN